MNNPIIIPFRIPQCWANTRFLSYLKKKMKEDEINLIENSKSAKTNKMSPLQWLAALQLTEGVHKACTSYSEVRDHWWNQKCSQIMKSLYDLVQ